MRRLLASLAAGSLLFAACGDDGGGGSNEYAEAMAKSMRQDEELPFDDQDIDCLSVEFVDALGGAERLEEEGIEPKDLASEDGLADLGLELGDEEARGIAKAFGDCEVSLAELVLDEAGDEVPAEVRSCVEKNLDEEVLADFFASVLVDEKARNEPPEELMEPLLQCF